MIKNIDLKFNNNSTLVLNRILNSGFDAYIVGGAVRDALLNKKISDVDIATSALPKDIKNLFENTYDVGQRFGTIGVVYENEKFEVTTFRTDDDYSDCRHPKSVSFNSKLCDDASRRDFTINALYYKKGRIYDFYGGLDDLKSGVLKTVGDADKRFFEDALRILRLFRFSGQLSFKIDEKTLLSAIKAKELIKNISNERISDELFKILNQKNNKYIKTVFEILNYNFDADKIYDFDDIVLKLSYIVFKTEEFKYLKYMPLKHGVKTEIINTAKALKNNDSVLNTLINFDKKVTQNFCKISDKLYKTEKMKKFNYYIDNNFCYKKSMLKINGNDVLACGVNKNDVGKTLDSVLNMVIKNNLPNEKKILLNIIRGKKF